MVLFLDSTDQEIRLALIGGRIFSHSFTATDLSKQLPLELGKFFRKNKVDFSQIKKIAVVTGPGGFSKTRTGVAAANAWAYARKLPVIGIAKGDVPKDLTELLTRPGRKMVEPVYDREPNITFPNATK